MKRISLVLGSILLAIPGAVAAQSTADARWDLTLLLGIHADRLDQPERGTGPLAGPPAGVTQAYTARGEAPTVGLGATRWLGAHLGLNVAASLAHNSSWSGVVTEGGTSPVKLTLFSSLGPVWRVFSPASHFQLQLGAGPALVTHTGSGASLLTRGTDLALMGLADVSVPVSHRLRLTLGARNYRFRSSFVDGGFQLPDGSYQYPAGSRSRSEWVIHTGLRLSF